jgi:predicted dithiol-disulfide oxidoreductase (DUF899 family)
MSATVGVKVDRNFNSLAKRAIDIGTTKYNSTQRIRKSPALWHKVFLREQHARRCRFPVTPTVVIIHGTEGGVMNSKKIVSREEWLSARKRLLEKEKAHMREGDKLAAERRGLPWLKIEKSYTFETEQGRKTLADLFNGRGQLVVHHLMFGPNWNAACPSCSFQAEHIDEAAQHLLHHNVTIVAISRAPLPKILAYKKRMGWRFEWVSSFGSDFNYDFHASFTKEQIDQHRINYNSGSITTGSYINEELPGLSVITTDESGELLLTYSTYARGLDVPLATHRHLDLTLEYCDEAGHPGFVDDMTLMPVIPCK